VPNIHCIGCQALVLDLPDSLGPEHTYIGASPGCWTIFNGVQMQHLYDPQYGHLPFLATNTYMVQHPGVPGPQAINSVALHLIGLYGDLDMKWSYAYTVRLMGQAARPQFFWLEPPKSYPLTIVDISHSENVANHVKRIREWAASTWQAWSAHHATIRQWAAAMAG
jgi:hypothetical protein